MKKKKENLTGYLFILPAIILFLFFVLIPVIAMVCLGFTKYNLFSAPQWTGFSNFAKIFTDGRLWTVTKNTIFLAFFSVILNIVVGLFLALLIANKRSPVFNYLVRLFYFSHSSLHRYILRLSGQISCLQMVDCLITIFKKSGLKL